MFFIDGAFPEIDRIRDAAVAASYRDVRGPDGDDYRIDPDVPEWIATALYSTIHRLVGPVEPTALFFRCRTERGPYWAHTDSKLAEAAALLYLTRDADIPDGAGIAYVRHRETRLDSYPEAPEELAVWRRDKNSPDLWDVVDFIPMRYGRLVLMPGRSMHAAQPIEGFGTTTEDGRLVLTTFLNRL